MGNNISELSLESLIKQRNLLKGTAIGSGIILFLAFAIIFYIAIENKNLALIATLPVSMIALILIFIRFRQVNTEIKSRQTRSEFK